eukprot:gene8464-biopygen9172
MALTELAFAMYPESGVSGPRPLYSSTAYAARSSSRKMRVSSFHFRTAAGPDDWVRLAALPWPYAGDIPPPSAHIHALSTARGRAEAKFTAVLRFWGPWPCMFLCIPHEQVRWFNGIQRKLVPSAFPVDPETAEVPLVGVMGVSSPPLHHP